MRSVEVLQSMQIAKLGPIKLAPALTTQLNHDCDDDDDSMYSFIEFQLKSLLHRNESGERWKSGDRKYKVPTLKVQIGGVWGYFGGML